MKLMKFVFCNESTKKKKNTRARAKHTDMHIPIQPQPLNYSDSYCHREFIIKVK